MENESYVFCVNVSVYFGHLTYGSAYRVLEVNQAKEQLRLQSDSGKRRWFPGYCFSATKPLRVKEVELADPCSLDFVDVHVRFDNETQYWTTFSTPDGLNRFFERNPDEPAFTSQNLVLVKNLNSREIEEAIRFLESSNRLWSVMQPL